MTSVGVFYLGTASAAGPTTHYAWSIRHGDNSQDETQLTQAFPTGNLWSNDFVDPSAWTPLNQPDSWKRPNNWKRPDPFSQWEFDEPGSGRPVPAPPPLQWLTAPPPQPQEPWQPGNGVVALFPWLLSMSLVGGQDANTRTSPAPGPSTSPASPGLPPASSSPGSGPRPESSPARNPTQNGKLHELYRWKQVDYEFPDEGTRARAVASGDYIPANNLPLGVETWKDRIFVSIPRWKPGVPATLAYISKYPNGDNSPKLRPYPDWSWHRNPRKGQKDSCQALTSVFRMFADDCGRLWVIDSGAVDVIGDIKVFCPPQIVIFDLNTDKLVWRYTIPEDQLKSESLFTNIVVDIRDGKCDDAFAYAADVFRFGLLVYSWKEDRSWRISNNLFFPDPIASRYELDGVTFRWTDGIFGLALSPVENNDRNMYFHPMSSFREFVVPASVIRNESYALAHPDEFRAVGEPRARNQSQSSASAMDRRGVLFFNLVTQDALGCWDSKKEYHRASVGIVSQDHKLINFPNDLKVDKETPQNIWLLSNRLHIYLYKQLDPKEYNFRILTGTVEEATKGTICDPEKPGPKTLPTGIDACSEI